MSALGQKRTHAVQQAMSAKGNSGHYWVGSLGLLMTRTATLLVCLLALLTLSPRCASADDEQLWAALMQGGKVILLRHTHVDIREGIGHLSPGKCADEVNLSSRGVEQAKRLGEIFRAHGIAIGEVLTSPYCRCIDTG